MPHPILNAMKISIASFSFHGLRAANMSDELILDPKYQRNFKEALAEQELTLVNYHTCTRGLNKGRPCAI